MPIPAKSRHNHTMMSVLTAVADLIEHHGHDNGTHRPGQQPLRLRAAINIARGYDTTTPVIYMPDNDRQLINQMFTRLEYTLPMCSIHTPANMWLAHANTDDMLSVLNVMLKGLRP